jgi:ankyrin repeat protein
VPELLLTNRADVNAKDNTVVAEIADSVTTDNTGRTPLYDAADTPYPPGVVKLLLANKADVNAKDSDGETPLHVASAKDYKDVVELLRQQAATNKLFGEYALWAGSNQRGFRFVSHKR